MKKNQKAEELKRILIVGSGGRENSIAWALSKNQSIEQIYVCPGNGGTAKFEKCICLKPNSEYEKLIINECQRLAIVLVIIGPEKDILTEIADDKHVVIRGLLSRK